MVSVEYPFLVRTAGYYWPGAITYIPIGQFLGINFGAYTWEKHLPDESLALLVTMAIEKDYE